jgi:hypothetical protein
MTVSSVRLFSGRIGKEYQSAKTPATIPCICGSYTVTGNCWSAVASISKDTGCVLGVTHYK